MYATNYALQQLVYEGKINVNDKAAKYFPEFRNGANDPIKGKAVLQATYPLVDTVITRAEQRKTADTIAYAKRAVSLLPGNADAAIVSAFNKRIQELPRKK